MSTPAKYTVISEEEFQAWETISIGPVSGDTEFTICDDDYNELYSAYVPDGKSLEDLNEIFAKYLNPFNPFDLFKFEDTGLQYADFDENTSKMFYVVFNNSQYNFRVYYDWSYNKLAYTSQGLDTVLTDSPVPVLDSRMYFLYTLAPSFRSVIDFSWENGDPFFSFNFMRLPRNTNFNIMQNFDVSTLSSEPGAFNVAFNENQFDVWQAIKSFGKSGRYLENNLGERFLVYDSCSSHCLYYRNDRGGWCWLLVNNGETRSETYTNSIYEKKHKWGFRNELTPDQYNNRQIVNYQKQIKTNWTVKTPLMTDDQSSKMAGLFRSNLIYLQDLNTREVTPVNITDTQFTEKTFLNQGRKVAQYTLNLQEAVTKKIIN